MRQKLIIVIIGIFLVLGISFLIFNNQKSNFTGFAVYDESPNEITREIASAVIKEVEKIINETKEQNLSVISMEDNLLEAKRLFEQAKYAEILRGNTNATEAEKTEARNALRLIDWKNIYYKDVLDYTSKIKEIREQEILLKDTILLRENDVNSLKGQLYSIGLVSSEKVDTSESEKILQEIKKAYEEERFNDVEKLLVQLRDTIEKERQQASTLASLKSGAMNFFQRYWLFIIIFLGVLIIIGIYSYNIINLKLLKDKILRMKTEKIVLLDLMKKAQTERFKENKISELVYNIRMKGYQEKMNKIKEQLPVLEDRLEKMKKT